MKNLPILETDVCHTTEEKIQDNNVPLNTLVTENQKSRRIERFSNEFEVPDDVTPLPLLNNSQNVFLYNICHKNQRPKSEFPGFRILGVFNDISEAAGFVNENYAGAKENIYCSPLHQFIPICIDVKNQLDDGYCKDYVLNLLDVHQEEIDQRKAEFEENLKNQTTGRASKSKNQTKEEVEQLEQSSLEFLESVKDLPKCSSILNSNKTISNQKYAVIICLSDIRPDIQEKQPLFALLYVSAEIKDCENYAKYTASKSFKDCNIDIVNLYEWGFPEEIDLEQLGAELYGNEKLNKIMETRKKSNLKIKEHDEWYKKAKIDPKEGAVEIGDPDLLPESLLEPPQLKRT